MKIKYTGGKSRSRPQTMSSEVLLIYAGMVVVKPKLELVIARNLSDNNFYCCVINKTPNKKNVG